MSKKNVIVISLGGSLIIPDEVDYSFLKKFHKTLKSFYKTHKFVLVCGGGSTARKYMAPLIKQKKSSREISLAGIRATRQNALLLIQFFGKKEANDALPKSMKSVKSFLKKNNVVFTGALKARGNSTTDETATRLANYLSCDFINLTNVQGLYTTDPKKNKNAKFIPSISFSDFEKITNKIKFKAGQHFVLDQRSASLIKKYGITTYIISGHDLKQLKNLLKGNKFKGTIIHG